MVVIITGKLKCPANKHINILFKVYVTIIMIIVFCYIYNIVSCIADPNSSCGLG